MCIRDSSITSRSKECQDYYKFLKENWIQKKQDPYVFEFKDEEPLNWWRLKEYYNHCKEDCMLGLARKQIINLLGVPSKSLRIRSEEAIYYCLRDDCLKKSEYDLSEYLSVTFDSLGKVNSFMLMPPPIKTIEDEE